MSETNAPIDEVFAAAPEEAAPAVKGEQQSEDCADLAPVTDSQPEACADPAPVTDSQPEACADLAQVTESQPEICVDLTQVTDSTGTWTPPLRGPEAPASTGSPTTDSGYAEATSRPETEKEEDQETLRAASLRALSSSPEFQSVGSTPSPERTIQTDTQPEFGREEIVGTSSPAGDDDVYATPAATPPSAQEEEDCSRTPTRTLAPVDESQLRVSPKRKIESMDLDLDSGTDLPTLQKKARAGSGCSDVDEDEHRWDVIPPPRDMD